MFFADIIFAIVFSASFALDTATANNHAKNYNLYTIVINPGHGEIDVK